MRVASKKGTPMPSDSKPFTIFRSAAEELAMQLDEQAWDNEGGRKHSTPAFVRHCPRDQLPYQVVLGHPHDIALRRSFATMREAEAFIRYNSPAAGPQLSTLYDRPASKS